MKKCKVDDCKNNHWARGYCRSHLNHLTRYGEIRRLRNSGNSFIDLGTHMQIVICDAHRKPMGIEVFIDKDDYEKCKDILWSYNGQYVKEGTSKYVRYLHRHILGEIPNDLVVDHINRNKLDNRRNNLRIVTRSENNKNK